MSKTRTVGIIALLVIALSVVGFAYAEWTDYVQIHGTANTNTFIVGIDPGSIETGDLETNPLGPFFTLSDDEMMLSEFTKEWGPATVTKTNVAGPGVRFDFTGLTSSGTGVGDNFPVNALAGGALKTYGSTQQFSTYGDFSTYREYRVKFKNVGSTDVTVNLKMNTGWTIPPPEYAAMWRDTYWQNGWTLVKAGETKVVTLYFCSAEVYNAKDPVNGDEQEYQALPDGTKDVAMWRTDEVSDIGFQVCGSGDGSIVVSAASYIPKNVGSCTATPSEGDGYVYHRLAIVVSGAYPSYHQWVKFNLKNAGSVPAHINDVIISDPYDELEWDPITSTLKDKTTHDPIINLVIWKYNNPDNRQVPLKSNQIDQGVCEWVWIWLHFKQPILEGHTYHFKIHIDAVQWNAS